MGQLIREIRSAWILLYWVRSGFPRVGVRGHFVKLLEGWEFRHVSRLSPRQQSVQRYGKKAVFMRIRSAYLVSLCPAWCIISASSLINTDSSTLLKHLSPVFLLV